MVKPGHHNFMVGIAWRRNLLALLLIFLHYTRFGGQSRIVRREMRLVGVFFTVFIHESSFLVDVSSNYYGEWIALVLLISILVGLS